MYNGGMYMKQIVFFCMLSFVLCGCAVISPISEETKSNRKTDIDMEIQTSSPEPDAEISSLEKEKYSKLEVVNKDIDAKKIMELIHNNKQLEFFKKRKGGEWTAQIDGINYTWEKTGSSLIYTNDKKIKETDKEDARKFAEDFIKRFGDSLNLSYSKASENKDEDGCYTFCYVQICEGINVMGEKTIYLPNNTEKAIHGSYIEITVDGTGIVSLFLQQVFDVKRTVKSYQREKDFINENKILETAKKHYEKLYADLKEKAEMEIQDIRVIYMPYEEGNAQYFIPVYDVTIHEKARKEPICMMMDAVTAYVYYAQ